LITKTVKGLKSVTDTLAYWIGSAKKDVHLAVSEMHFRTQQNIFVSDVEQSRTSKKKTYDKKNNINYVMYCGLGREKSEEQSVNKQVGLSQKYVINFLHKYKETGCKSVLHSILQPFISEAKRDMFTELYKEENKKLLSLEELCKTADTVTFKISRGRSCSVRKRDHRAK
jgi:hypothetical protein